SASNPARPTRAQPEIVKARGMNLLVVIGPTRQPNYDKSTLCSKPFYRSMNFMNKDQIAEILIEIGVLLELKGENPFKSRAYAAAARSLESLSEPLEKLIGENRLGEIKGIGEAIQKKIIELATTGKLHYY